MEKDNFTLTLLDLEYNKLGEELQANIVRLKELEKIMDDINTRCVEIQGARKSIESIMHSYRDKTEVKNDAE